MYHVAELGSLQMRPFWVSLYPRKTNRAAWRKFVAKLRRWKNIINTTIRMQHVIVGMGPEQTEIWWPIMQNGGYINEVDNIWSFNPKIRWYKRINAQCVNDGKNMLVFSFSNSICCGVWRHVPLFLRKIETG